MHVGLLLPVCVLGASVIYGQTVQFDAASVKPTDPPTFPMYGNLPNRRPGTTREQFRLMLQSLLADRFKLSVHWETRDTKVYALEVSPHVLKARKAENPPGVEGGHVIWGSKFTNSGRTERVWFLTSKWPSDPESTPFGITISELAKGISEQQFLDRALVDATGLDGYYDIQVTLPRDADQSNWPTDAAGRPSIGPNGPELLDAMEKQLGLRAEVKTMPIQVLVIDHLQRTPTEN